MKLTKVLREKTEKELTNARMEANKKASADYDNRRKMAFEEIKAVVNSITPTIKTILDKYGMDNNNIINSDTEPYRCDVILRIYDKDVKNVEEAKKLRDDETARYRKQQQMIEDFAIECELGVEKANFFEALANLCSKMAE